MSKTNKTEHKEKSVSGGIRNTFDSNHIEHFAGDSNGFTAFNYAEKAQKTQCDLCHPPLTARRGAAVLCPNCAESRERLVGRILSEVSRPRKIIKLKKCFACNGCFASSKFSQVFGICKGCLEKRDAPPSERRKFTARALHNIEKVLKNAMCL